MTTKTREEAIEEVERQVKVQQKNAGLCGQLEYTDISVFARCFKGGKFFNVVEEFTPPKPEFEKGTFGLDDDGWIGLYHSTGNRYIKMAYRTRDLEDASSLHNTSNFTPIYQTDPIEERAFELACNLAGSLPCRNCPLRLKECKGGDFSDCANDLKAHFLSKAKEELSK